MVETGPAPAGDNGNEIHVVPAKNGYLKGRIVVLLIGIPILALLVTGNLITPLSQHIHWAWTLIPIAFIGFGWSNYRPGSPEPVRFQFDGPRFSVSTRENEVVFLALVRKVRVRRDLIDRVLGLARIRVIHSGKHRLEIAGLLPEDAARAAAVILERKGTAARPWMGEKLTAAEWKTASQAGGWSRVSGKTAGFFTWLAMGLVAPFYLAFGLFLAAGMAYLAHGLVTGDKTLLQLTSGGLRANFWAWFALLPGELLFGAWIANSMVRESLEILLDVVTPVFHYRGRVERRFEVSTKRSTLHYVGSGPWDWYVPGLSNYKRMEIGCEILVRFHPRTQEASEFYMRQAEARR